MAIPLNSSGGRVHVSKLELLKKVPSDAYSVSIGSIQSSLSDSVTGSATASQVAFWSASSVLTGSPDFILSSALSGHQFALTGSLFSGYGATGSGIFSAALGYKASAIHNRSIVFSAHDSVSAASTTSEQIVFNAKNGVQGLSGTRFYLDASISSAFASNELVPKRYVDSLTSTGATVTGALSGVAVFALTSSLSSFADFKYGTYGLIVPSNIGTLSSTASTSSIALGVTCLASGQQSFAMGNSARATGHQSVAMGLSPIATGEGAISLGYSVTAGGQGSVSLGYQSSANAQGSIALGYRSKTSRQGQVSIANNGIGGVLGMNQSDIIVQHCYTSGSTPTILDAESKGYTMLLENWHNYVMMIQIAAISNSMNNTGSWTFRASTRRLASAAQTVLTVNNRFADLVPSGWDCTLSVNTTAGAFNITVTGGSGETVNWTGTLWITEVSI